MVDLQIWKIAADVLLIMSLIYLSYRIAKGTTEPLERKARGLEASLKMLLDEADQASKQLNDKLGKRQSELQKSLFDLKTLEDRLESSLTKSESVDLRLQEYLRNAEKQSQANLESEKRISSLIQELDQKLATFRATETARANTNNTANFRNTNFQQNNHTSNQNITNNQNREDTVEINFEAELNTGKTGINRAQERFKASNLSHSQNIYGERIRSSESQMSTTIPTAPIAEEERLDYKPKNSNRNPNQIKYQETQGLQEVYDAAEKMLRAGIDVNKVITATSLSADEVQLLAQMLKREDALKIETQMVEPKVSDEDPRLGILASMRRQAVQL
jgi:hypothetical protein